MKLSSVSGIITQKQSEVKCTWFTTYDLVSRGDTVNEECRGTFNSDSQTGWGNGYRYACIHSGNIRASGDLATTWYNYALASAGTIYDDYTPTSSNPAANAAPATESICPKGWTLPPVAQIRIIGNKTSTYIPSLSPVGGGNWGNGTLSYESNGYLWSSESASDAARSARRMGLSYNVDTLYSSNGYSRFMGYYIRCINKQKTVLDLTYMQEMTPEIASPPQPLDYFLGNSRL